MAFQYVLWLGAVAVVMSFVTALVAARPLVRPISTPTGAMGTDHAAAVRLLAHGDRTVNLMSAGATSASSAAAADLLTDLKSGLPAGGQSAQAVHCSFSRASSSVWWPSCRRGICCTRSERPEAFPLPATEMWKAVAVALTQAWIPSPKWPVLGRRRRLVGIAIPVVGRCSRSEGRICRRRSGWVWPGSSRSRRASRLPSARCWPGAGRDCTSGPPTSTSTPSRPVFIAGESIVLALMAMAATAVQLIK